MSLVLYDMAAPPGRRRWSPYGWRVRMALAHKGLAYKVVPVGLTEIAKVVPLPSPTGLPVLSDGDLVLDQSWAIATHLEDNHPGPALFGEATDRATTRFIDNWSDDALVGALRLILAWDLYLNLPDEDKPYFRQSREARFGCALEEVRDRRPAEIDRLREVIAPLRTTLGNRPFIAGESPKYADYSVFGPFQCAFLVSDLKLLAPGDPIGAWQARMRGLFGGLGAQATD